MKLPLAFYVSILLIGGRLVSACSSSTAENKQARLEQLKKEQTQITQEIRQLEEELALENPDSAAVRVQEVEAITLSPQRFDYFVQTQGFVEVEDNIQVSAKSAGVITEILVQEGDWVRKGQALARIDNSLILSNIEEAKTALELADNLYVRQQKLWDQKIGTEIQYLQAKNNKESLEKRLATLHTQDEMAQIIAPISGVVDEVNSKEGENIAPGLPAFRIINTDHMKIKADVSEAYISHIEKGDRVIVSIPEVSKTLEAPVSFVSTNINPLSRSFTLEVKLPSMPELRPNMAAIVKVVFHHEPSAVVVPVSVVQAVKGQNVVYVAEANGNRTVARRKVVEVSEVYGDQVQATSGLQPGDQVITVGFQGLRDGELIRL